MVIGILLNLLLILIVMASGTLGEFLNDSPVINGVYDFGDGRRQSKWPVDPAESFTDEVGDGVWNPGI